MSSTEAHSSRQSLSVPQAKGAHRAREKLRPCGSRRSLSAFSRGAPGPAPGKACLSSLNLSQAQIWGPGTGPPSELSLTWRDPCPGP